MIIVPSGVVHSLKATDITASGFRVEYLPPPQHQLNGILRGYNIRYAVKGLTLLYNTSSTWYICKNLQPFTEYAVSVAVYNSAGIGVYSEPIIIKTKTDRKCSSFDRFNYLHL